MPHAQVKHVSYFVPSGSLNLSSGILAHSRPVLATWRILYQGVCWVVGSVLAQCWLNTLDEKYHIPVYPRTSELNKLRPAFG